MRKEIGGCTYGMARRRTRSPSAGGYDAGPGHGSPHTVYVRAAIRGRVNTQTKNLSTVFGAEGFDCRVIASLGFPFEGFKQFTLGGR